MNQFECDRRRLQQKDLVFVWYTQQNREIMNYYVTVQSIYFFHTVMARTFGYHFFNHFFSFCNIQHTKPSHCNGNYFFFCFTFIKSRNEYSANHRISKFYSTNLFLFAPFSGTFQLNLLQMHLSVSSDRCLQHYLHVRNPKLLSSWNTVSPIEIEIFKWLCKPIKHWSLHMINAN